jgi:GMP synthase PP-ATPase subunit
MFRRQTRHGPARVLRARPLFTGDAQGVTDPSRCARSSPRIHRCVRGKQARGLWTACLSARHDLSRVIESESPLKGPSQTIKSHHIVGGLARPPEVRTGRALRELFKDEVRGRGGRVLGMGQGAARPPAFPRNGMGVRILGEVTAMRWPCLRWPDLRVAGGRS